MRLPPGSRQRFGRLLLDERNGHARSATSLIGRLVTADRSRREEMVERLRSTAPADPSLCASSIDSARTAALRPPAPDER